MLSEAIVFRGLISGWFVVAILVFVFLLFVSAPYGRHSRTGWGVRIGDRPGWVIMEAPAPLVFAACFVLGRREMPLVNWAFLFLWEAHYVHRAFVYPLGLRSRNGHMPIFVVSLGFVFNGVNAYLNGRYLFTFSTVHGGDWLLDPRFMLGVALFLIGSVINRHADHVLRGLREPGATGYGVPRGGLYRWISCPNYLGEIIIWTGWGVATWSLPGLAFAAWTVANLAPRARSHHRWYLGHFPDYPAGRRALIPGVW